MLTATTLPKRIAVAVDGSDPSFRAVSYASNLAKAFGSTVVIMHVLLLPPGATGETLNAVRKEMSSKGEEVLKKASDLAKSSGVSTEKRIVETNRSISVAIVELASKEKADLIVLGTQGTSGYSKLMLGSTAAGTVSIATCPVLSVR